MYFGPLKSTHKLIRVDQVSQYSDYGQRRQFVPGTITISLSFVWWVETSYEMRVGREAQSQQIKPQDSKIFSILDICCNLQILNYHTLHQKIYNIEIIKEELETSVTHCFFFQRHEASIT